MKKFIGSTAGLFAVFGNQNPSLVRIEFNKVDADTIELQPVSGRNLMPLSCGRILISKIEFENRAVDPFDSTVEAIWALNRCGYSVCGTDESGE